MPDGTTSDKKTPQIGSYVFFFSSKVHDTLPKVTMLPKRYGENTPFCRRGEERRHLIIAQSSTGYGYNVSKIVERLDVA